MISNSCMNDIASKKVVTRFAPSPTGVLHIGSVRTALFNFLYARQHGGTFLLRIEDTDKERSSKEFEDDILDGLAWLGITHDAFYRQSERGEIYKKHLEALIASGAAYISKEESVEEGKRGEVIRFKNPGTKVTFRDEIRGDIEFDTTELGDFVLAKDLDTPLYHFAVVVDDFEMEVTHVIRGDDGIANTPRQILIQEALGAPRPVYAHLPMILASDRSKLSKRHGAVAVTEYRAMGYLPEAIINFVAFLGWNPGDEREIFSMEELISTFVLEKVQKSGGVFNIEKLNWINRHYMNALSESAALERILEVIPPRIKILPRFDEVILRKILSLLLERADRFDDVRVACEAGEYDYFFAAPEYAPEKLLWKGEPDHTKTAARLETLVDMLQSVPMQEFTNEAVKDTVWNFAEQEGRGAVLWPLRFALSGRERSPDPFILTEVLGKEETISRITHAIRALTVTS